jgi:co-chaperonin GroES (HSP10)|tara:strand:+ start:457 stop:732 length:276 start_codon:yes stop_codon:yes gene_type:complete
MDFKPRNRHILVELESQEEEEESIVLLPDSQIIRREEYILALVRDISPDCKLDISIGDKVIAPGNVVIDVQSDSGCISLIQENYILGVYRK